MSGWVAATVSIRVGRARHAQEPEQCVGLTELDCNTFQFTSRLGV